MRIAHKQITNVPIVFDNMGGTTVKMPASHTPNTPRTDEEIKDAQSGKYVNPPLSSSTSGQIQVQIGKDGSSVDITPLAPYAEGVDASISAFFTNTDGTVITIGPLMVTTSANEELPSGHFDTLKVTTRPVPNPWGKGTKEENAVHHAQEAADEAKVAIKDAEAAVKKADAELEAAKKAQKDADKALEAASKAASEKAEADKAAKVESDKADAAKKEEEAKKADDEKKADNKEALAKVEADDKKAEDKKAVDDKNPDDKKVEDDKKSDKPVDDKSTVKAGEPVKIWPFADKTKE